MEERYKSCDGEATRPSICEGIKDLAGCKARGSESGMRSIQQDDEKQARK